MEENQDDSTQVVFNNSDHLNNVNWSRKLVEIPVFLFFLAFALGETVFGNLVIFRTCNITYGYNETLCASLISNPGSNDTKHIEEQVQSYASQINMGKSLLTGICPAILSLFLGPWSDVNGRKPLILASTIGYFSYFCISALFSQLNSLDPLWLLLPAVPFSLMGGISSLITGCFCYIADITDVTNRSFKMVLVEGYLFTGILIGSLISPYLFNACGYLTVFCVAGFCIFIGCIYSVIMVESLPHYKIKKCGVFSKKLVTGMLKTSFQRRSNYGRSIIWLVMMASSFGIFAQEGEISVMYLFVREKLSWELKQYSWFSAANILTTVLGAIIVTVLFQKVFKARDSVVSMIAFMASALKSILTAIASDSWQMYMSCLITGPRAAFGPSNRSILSKAVPNEDVGKVLSLTTSLETIIPLISAPLYSFMYQATLTTFPGAFNLISMALYGISFIFLLIVDLLQRRYPDSDHDLLVNTSVEEDQE